MRLPGSRNAACVSAHRAADSTGPSATSIVDINPATIMALNWAASISALAHGTSRICQAKPPADAATHNAISGKPRLGPNAGEAL